MPPGVTTLATVTLQAQQRADMVNSQFISAAEWTSYIQASHQELYGLIVQAFGNDYFVQTPFAITTDGTNYLYALPPDFFKLLGLDLQAGNSPNSWLTLKPFSFTERNRYGAPGARAYGVTDIRYRLAGNNLWLTPLPAAGQQLQLWYIPRLTLPVNATDTIDGVDGWEEFIVVDAAIKALQKEESDVSVLMAQKRALMTRIEEESERRDAGSPATVADTSKSNGWGGGDGFGWGQ